MSKLHALLVSQMELSIWLVSRHLVHILQLLTISESGETMKAAGLKAIDTVVSSTAVLIQSKKPSNPEVVELITARIRGVISKVLISPYVFSLTVCSCSKIRSLPVQCATHQTSRSNKDHTWQESTNHQCSGRRGMGRCQFYG